MSPRDKSKLRALAGLCMACVILTGAYAWKTAAPPVRNVALPPISRSADLELAPAPVLTKVPDVAQHAPPAPGAGPAATPSSTAWRPAFLVRHTGLDQSYGRLAIDSGTGGPGNRQATELECESVSFGGDRGVCLEARRGVITTYSAVLFDSRFHTTRTLPLAGIPSRTRVSPDGRYAAVTVFISGHSYGGTDFSTETQIIDAVTGTPVVANLEQLEVWSDKGRIDAADRNFWGVTFTADRNRFYASLGTGGVVYLVRGDIAAHRVDIVKPGVECPSLSPDNTRVAFKKRVPGSGLAKWRLYVLDLASLTETAVAESRFIDEQVEWLDDGHILYTQVASDAPSPAVSDVWVVPADGTGQPELLIREAASPAVLHRAARTVATR